MKFLLVFLLVLVVAWRWRTWREATQLKNGKTEAGGSTSGEMVPCSLCGLHLPANEAVVGKLGSYCSQEHRLKVEP